MRHLQEIGGQRLQACENVAFRALLNVSGKQEVARAVGDSQHEGIIVRGLGPRGGIRRPEKFPGAPPQSKRSPFSL